MDPTRGRDFPRPGRERGPESLRLRQQERKMGRGSRGGSSKAGEGPGAPAKRKGRREGGREGGGERRRPASRGGKLREKTAAGWRGEAWGRRGAAKAAARPPARTAGRGACAGAPLPPRASGAGGPARHHILRLFFLGLIRAIDTCAAATPAANIFLMSSRGLEQRALPSRVDFPPADVSGGGGARGLGEGGTNLSLGGARAEDFLLKFKRKTGFHSAPKNVFPGGQWAAFCASQGQRGRRSGDLCAWAPPDRLAHPLPPSSGELGLPSECPTERGGRTWRERKCAAGWATGPGEPLTL